MRIIKKQMHNYGEADFDADYLTWGFHDLNTQIEEAESILHLIKSTEPQKILDLAGGIGIHAITWAKNGHTVLGMDISETFIAKATESAKEIPSVSFLVSDIKSLNLADKFNVITWIEMSFIDADILLKIYNLLQPGGCFICDIRNSEHPRYKAQSGNWRTWREENGVFKLERHETNLQTGKREDVWITIDPQNEIIEEKSNISDSGLKTEKILSELQNAGFTNCALYTMAGDLFTNGCEPYWLWIVAQK